MVQSGPRQAELAIAMPEPLVADGLRSLAPHAADLPPDLAHDVRDAGHVLLGEGELVHGLPALALVLGDAGGLLEHRAPLLRLRGQHLVDLALRHDRIAGPADAGIHEKLVDVLQAAGLPIEIILAFAIPMHAAHDLDLMEFAPELLLAFREQEGHFADLGGLPRVGALENHVLHAPAAQRLRALLAEHPADCIGDIRFAAAVGSDNRGDTGLEAKGRGIGETFKAVQLQRLEIHAG
jgi:hypothetical protein